MTRRAALLSVAVAASTRSQDQATPVIVDTDVGSDDLMAIAFLLARPDVRIEAITVANGLAHVDRGAANLTRLLTLAAKPDIPVYAGRPSPMRGDRAFPGEWRRASDDLPGVHLPSAKRKPEARSAVDFLALRLGKPGSRPVRMLALGPLTNLAELLQSKPAAASVIQQLVIMGGALRVPGNLGDGGTFKTTNKTAEWNIYIDPFAASIVFRSRLRPTLIPLDATGKVPIDPAFVHEFQKHAHTALGRFVSDILEADRPHIEGGYFQAWDPLAAVALVNPNVVRTKPVTLEVRQSPPDDGQTLEAQGRTANVTAALDADAEQFKRTFMAVF
jgi:pyrimidine-specific ribonucleoside hydrolase